MSDSDLELVVVKHMSHPGTAQLVAQLLISEGIPTFVDGNQLQDPVAMSQKLLGTVACDVQVPKEFEVQAREALAAAAEAGQHLGETEEWRQGADASEKTDQD